MVDLLCHFPSHFPVCVVLCPFPIVWCSWMNIEKHVWVSDLRTTEKEKEMPLIFV